MPLAARHLIAIAACAAAFVAATAHAATGPTASLLAPLGVCGPAADQLNLDQATAERTLLCLTNYARRHAGLSALKASPLLDQAGQAKLADDIACGELTHTPCGIPFRTVFARYLAATAIYAIGENIAWGTGSRGTARQTMDGWLHSVHHRDNILNPRFRELGIGYLPNQAFQGYTGATFWSQEFGTRLTAPR